MRHGHRTALTDGRHPGRLSLLLALPLGMVPSFVYGWGADGHADQTQLIFDNLPSAVRSLFTAAEISTAVNTWSDEPDQTGGFSASVIGQAAVDKLTAGGVTRRSDLHQDLSRGVAYTVLIDAFKEKNYDHVAYWIGALSHATGDMSSENHDPTSFSVTYAWNPYQLKLPNGGTMQNVANMLDLTYAYSDPTGKATVQNWITANALADDGRNAQTAVVDVMMRGPNGSAALAPVGAPLVSDAAAWVDRGDAAARQRVFNGFAQVAGAGVVNTIQDILVAKRLGDAGTTKTVDAATTSAYTTAKNTFINQFPLASDALLAPLISTPPAAAGPAIGIVFEPTWQHGESMLGFPGRLAAAETARTLAQANQRYRSVDLRDLLSTGLPSPTQMPVLVLCATTLYSYGPMSKSTLDTKLKAYMDAGGKVVWVGGTAPLVLPTSLGTIQSALSQPGTSDGTFPVTSFASHSLKLDTTVGSLWAIAHDPTGGSWVLPANPYVFANPAASGLTPLLRLVGGAEGANDVVGVTWAKGAYLPIYALSPDLCSNDVIIDPGQPVLDHVGQSILLTTFSQMNLPDFTISVPEPASGTLLAVVGAVMAGRRGRRR